MKPQDDPTISRIRETRHRISERFGHDPQKLVDYYIEFQKQYQDRILDEAVMWEAQTTKGARSFKPVSVLREGEPIYTVEGADTDESEHMIAKPTAQEMLDRCE